MYNRGCKAFVVSVCVRAAPSLPQLSCCYRRPLGALARLPPLASAVLWAPAQVLRPSYLRSRAPLPATLYVVRSRRLISGRKDRMCITCARRCSSLLGLQLSYVYVHVACGCGVPRIVVPAYPRAPSQMAVRALLHASLALGMRRGAVVRLPKRGGLLQYIGARSGRRSGARSLRSSCATMAPTPRRVAAPTWRR